MLCCGMACSSFVVTCNIGEHVDLRLAFIAALLHACCLPDYLIVC